MMSLSFEEEIKKKNEPLPGSTPSPIQYSLRVKQKYDGCNILDFLSKNVPSVKKEDWIKKINSGNLTINNAITNTQYAVNTGDLSKHSTPPLIEPNVSIDIQLIYEDQDILVLNKPAPLPMHTCGRFHKNTLSEILKTTFPNKNLKIIHRLDSNTTGLVVFGKTKEATAFVSKQFEQHLVSKQYLALVEGTIDKTSFESHSAISTFKTPSGGRNIDQNGSEAYTSFKVLERLHNSSLLLVNPKSGKTNQIRLHLAEIGHPIIGDIGYKDPTYFKKHPLTYPTDTLYLHAWKLTFTHPTTKKKIAFEAPMPSKFKTKNSPDLKTKY